MADNSGWAGAGMAGDRNDGGVGGEYAEGATVEGTADPNYMYTQAGHNGGAGDGY